jgi:peptidoglycan/xylan/chitin deacetylase (PgdA/CDA1 family)
VTPADHLVYLMYHEIELPGRPMCQDEPGYVRYIVSASDFGAQMQALKDSGVRGMSVSEALASPRYPGVVITFDDGSETDLITAAPLLRQVGFNGIFYVTVGFLGKRGYLSHGQLRQLSDLGLEVGSHSMTHPYLTDLSDEQLVDELAGSKHELEQITGRPIHHFSCPGGRWDRRVVAKAKQAGYHSVSTSRASANSAGTDPFALGRVAIMRGTSLATFRALAKGHGLWTVRLKDSARASARRLLSNTIYDRVRTRILAHKQESR